MHFLSFLLSLLSWKKESLHAFPYARSFSGRTFSDNWEVCCVLQQHISQGDFLSAVYCLCKQLFSLASLAGRLAARALVKKDIAAVLLCLTVTFPAQDTVSHLRHIKETNKMWREGRSEWTSLKLYDNLSLISRQSMPFLENLCLFRNLSV